MKALLMTTHSDSVGPERDHGAMASQPQHMTHAEAPAHQLAPPADLNNIVALQAVAYQLLNIYEKGARSVAERSTAVQALGAEVEQRALKLIDQVRAMRGIEPPKAARVLPLPTPASSLPPEPARPARMTGDRVRQAMVRLGGSFTMSELVAELGVSKATVTKFIKPMLLAGTVKEDGHVGRKMTYRYEPPPVPPDPTSRPTRRPPEREPPAGTEARATGMPVRVSAGDKASRRSRSTPGVRHQIVQKDKRYERMQEAREQRAQEQREKAFRERTSGGKRKR